MNPRNDIQMRLKSALKFKLVLENLGNHKSSFKNGELGKKCSDSCYVKQFFIKTLNKTKEA